jgi:hypothetical protein
MRGFALNWRLAVNGIQNGLRFKGFDAAGALGELGKLDGLDGLDKLDMLDSLDELGDFRKRIDPKINDVG